MNKIKLPRKINVNVTRGISGSFVAELNDYSQVTEAKTLNELFINVNDLIYTIFDVPKKLQEKIRYIPPLRVRLSLVEMEKNKNSKTNLILDAFSPEKFNFA